MLLSAKTVILNTKLHYGRKVYTHMLSALSLQDYDDIYVKQQNGVEYTPEYITSRWKVSPEEVKGIYTSEYLLNNDPQNGGNYELVYDALDRVAGTTNYKCYIDDTLHHTSVLDSIRCVIYKLCLPKYLVYTVLDDDRLDLIRDRVNFVKEIKDNTITYGQIKDREEKKNNVKRIR